MKIRFVYFLLIPLLFVFISKGQDKREMLQLEKLTSKCDSSDYYLLLNSNATCYGCFVAHAQAIQSSKILYSSVVIVTTNEIYTTLLSKIGLKNLRFCFVQKKLFEQLFYLRYRNALIGKSKQDYCFKIISELTPQNSKNIYDLINQ